MNNLPPLDEDWQLNSKVDWLRKCIKKNGKAPIDWILFSKEPKGDKFKVVLLNVQTGELFYCIGSEQGNGYLKYTLID